MSAEEAISAGQEFYTANKYLNAVQEFTKVSWPLRSLNPDFYQVAFE